MAKKKDIAEQEVLATEEDSSEARVYEIAFHLDPELSESEAQRAYDGIREVAAQGTIVAEGAPEKIQLAYTISRSENAGRRDFDSAHFCWVAYEGNGTVHAAVTAGAAAEGRIIRFLDLRTDKETAQHAAEQRELREKMPVKNEEEPVSDVELNAALESAQA